MSTTPLLNLSWILWKASWKNVFATAAVAAGLEAGAFSLFLYMFFQDGNRLLPIVGGSLLIFWSFHVGVSALHAYLISHCAISGVVAPFEHSANETSPESMPRDVLTVTPLSSESSLVTAPPALQLLPKQ